MRKIEKVKKKFFFSFIGQRKKFTFDFNLSFSYIIIITSFLLSSSPSSSNIKHFFMGKKNKNTKTNSNTKTPVETSTTKDEKPKATECKEVSICPCSIVLSVLVVLLAILTGYIFLSGATYAEQSVLRNPDGASRMSPNFLGVEGDFYKSNVSGLYLHHRYWAPNKNASVYSDPEYNIDSQQMRYPRAIVVLTPGRYLHASSGWLDNFAGRLANEGAVAVFAFDQAGFGKSEGDRGYAQSFETLLDEAEAFVRMARAKFPGVPTVCAGEDISAYTMAHLSFERPLFGKNDVKANGKNILCNGVAMVAPPNFGFIEALYNRYSLVRKIVNLASTYIPKLPVPVYYPMSMLTADKDVAAAFAADKYASRMFRVRTLKIMMDAKKALLDQSKKITAILEIVQGQNDTLTSDAYNQAVLAGAKSLFKSVGIIKKSKHFLLTDKDARDETYSEFTDWLRLAIYNMVEDFDDPTTDE